MAERVKPIEKYALHKERKKNHTLFSKIGVVGCGRDGQFIARLAAQHEIDVVFLEVSQNRIDKAYEGISGILDQHIDRWSMTQGEKRLILSRIKGTLKYEDLKDCDFVVEVIRADVNTGRSIEVRQEIFKKIENVVRPDCVIATHTATFVISSLVSNLKHRDRCLSLRFSTASSEGKLVEVVKGLDTSDKTVDRVVQFIKTTNRTPIHVQESAGLVSVRLFVPLLNEACRILMEGVASITDIDKIMEIGDGMRFGPFTHADRIGLDTVVRWMHFLFDEYGEVRYKANSYLNRLVRAGHLGVQTGKGFYDYDENGNIINS